MPSIQETIVSEYTKIQLRREIDMSEQFFIGLIIIGCIIKLLTAGLNMSSSTNNNAGINGASGTIWGYFLILFAILVKVPWYFYVLIGIITWVLSLNIMYYKQISKNNIPISYYTWDIWSSVFIIIVTCIIVFRKMINEEDLEPNNTKFIKFINISIGIILFLNIIIIGIQNIILQHFSVDG